MPSSRIACLATFLSCSAANAQAGEVVPLARAGNWEVGEGTACELGATFRHGGVAARLIFTGRGPWDDFDITLVSSDFASVRPMARVTVDFGPIVNARDAYWALLSLGDGSRALRLNGQRFDDIPIDPDKKLPKVTPEQVAAVEWLTITVGDSAYRFGLGSMRRPKAALDQCIDRLMVRWGYDPEVQATLSKPAEPANYPGSWATSNDYPGEARRKGMTGTVWFRLDLGDDGRVNDCHVVTATADPVLQARTCSLLKVRARFTPARDAAGNAVKSFYVNRVRWLL